MEIICYVPWAFSHEQWRCSRQIQVLFLTSWHFLRGKNFQSFSLRHLAAWALTIFCLRTCRMWLRNYSPGLPWMSRSSGCVLQIFKFHLHQKTCSQRCAKVVQSRQLVGFIILWWEFYTKTRCMFSKLLRINLNPKKIFIHLILILMIKPDQLFHFPMVLWMPFLSNLKCLCYWCWHLEVFNNVKNTPMRQLRNF